LARLNVFFDTLNSHLEGREFVAIDTFSNADITAVVAIDFARIVKFKPDENRHQNLIRWRSALASRESLAI